MNARMLVVITAVASGSLTTEPLIAQTTQPRSHSDRPADAANPPSSTVGDPPSTLDPAARRVLALQVALDRAGFSPGEIDAAPGKNTERALQAFQQARGLAAGEANAQTIEALGPAYAEPATSYTVSEEDAAGPFLERVPSDMMEKSTLPALSYTSVLERLAERFHASPKLLQRLNPRAKFAAGEIVSVPNVEPFEPPGSSSADEASGKSREASEARARQGGAAKRPPAETPRPGPVTVTVTEKTLSLQVQNAAGETIFHAPVTVGSTNDPLPVGEWKVTGVSRLPTFNYNPKLFWDADPSHAKARIAPGPNNPVGVVWIDLSKEHYGIHGTPEPSRISYAESHGCIRLTNWDAMRLASLVAPGTKVILR